MSVERDAAAAHALLHAIIGDGADAIFVKDRELRYTMCNEVSERLAGLQFADIVGKTDHDFMSAESADILAAQDRRVIQTGATESVEERLVVDGQSRVFVTTKFPHRGTDGTIEGLVGVARDITRHVRAPEHLRPDETFLRLVLDAMPVGVVVIDMHGDIVLGNEAARRIWGESIVLGNERWRRSRGRFRATGELVQPHEWASVRALFEGVPQLDQVIDIESMDGARRTIRNSAVPIAQSTGFRGAVIVNEEVTERVRLEEGLAHARKIEAIGQLAGSVAHDFNNLLTIIMSYVEILGGVVESDEQRRADLAEIQKAAESAAALTRQLLAFGRREVVQPKDVCLEQVVAGVEKMLARLIGEHIRIRTDYAPVANIVHIDPFQVEQIVLNLAVNARDAMPDGGCVTIATSTVEVKGSRFARLTVTDTGMGMDEGTRARAFEPFFTTKDRGRGTGLGLATVSGIVAQSGGTIRVASEPGRGTTFEIDLPIAEAPTASDATPDGAATLRGTERILLVEDSTAVRLAVRAILERYGYQVHDVGDAAAALLHVADDGVTVDALVIDVVLPSMNGPASRRRSGPSGRVCASSTCRATPPRRCRGTDHPPPATSSSRSHSRATCSHARSARCSTPCLEVLDLW
jgi:two-component system cell cycle sensor histidine kinase/response regulator CckA